MKKQYKSNQLRIIAGKWRGRKLTFPDIKDLRPTSDRIRETLFNWLAPIIHNTICIDPFAGSGTLGFEALSRGAGFAILADQSKEVVEQLKYNKEILQCNNLEIHQQDGLSFLSNFVGTGINDRTQPFIIFLDPPFQSNLLEKSIELLAQSSALKAGDYIYIETSKDKALPVLPEHWFISKQSTAGNVAYYLISM